MNQLETRALHVIIELFFEAGKGHVDYVDIKARKDIGFGFSLKQKLKRGFNACCRVYLATGEPLIGRVGERHTMLRAARRVCYRDIKHHGFVPRFLLYFNHN